MTINELISELSQYDGEREIYIQDDGMEYIYRIRGSKEKKVKSFWGKDENEIVLMLGSQIGKVN